MGEGTPLRQPPVLIIRRVHAVRSGMILLRRLRKWDAL